MKSRVENEKQTVATMIYIYCRTHHKGTSSLCPDCEELLSYATTRLDSCPFDNNKKACSRCEIHCYKPSMRTKIAEVMRYSGKRIIFYAPFAALRHIFGL